jgi:hypothetical protein
MPPSMTLQRPSMPPQTLKALPLCERIEADAFLRGCPIAKGGHFPAEII